MPVGVGGGGAEAVQQLLGLGRATHSIAGELQQGVDGISRRLSSLCAAVEGLEEGLLRRNPGQRKKGPPPPAARLAGRPALA